MRRDLAALDAQASPPREHVAQIVRTKAAVDVTVRAGDRLVVVPGERADGQIATWSQHACGLAERQDRLAQVRQDVEKEHVIEAPGGER